MEILISIAVIAAIIWLFARHNTKSGKRAVGAHVYLTALEQGRSRHEAQAEAEDKMREPGKTLIHRTYERLLRDHGGKARALLKSAEAKGFRG